MRNITSHRTPQAVRRTPPSPDTYNQVNDGVVSPGMYEEVVSGSRNGGRAYLASSCQEEVYGAIDTQPRQLRRLVFTSYQHY